MATGSGTVLATIAAGASLSGAVDLTLGDGGRIAGTPVGLMFPDAWTAAGLGFEVSMDGVTYLELQDVAGTPVALVVVADDAIPLTVRYLQGWKYIKLQSGTLAAPVNQVAEAIITIALAEL